MHHVLLTSAVVGSRFQKDKEIQRTISRGQWWNPQWLLNDRNDDSRLEVTKITVLGLA